MKHSQTNHYVFYNDNDIGRVIINYECMGR